MFHLDNSSGIGVMPELNQALSRQPQWFTEGDTQTPPSYPGADWFNIVQAELLNVLKAGDITPEKVRLNQLSNAIKNIINKNQNDASLTVKGMVKLSSAIDSTSETLAATPAAVKKINDYAVTANSNASRAHNRIDAIADKFALAGVESRVYSNDKKTYLLVRDDGIIAAYNTEKNKMVWGFDAQGDLGVGTVHSNHVVGLSEHVTNMFNQSFGRCGYTRLPNGLIIQWGTANSLGSDMKNGTLQSFFVAFPNACLSVVTNDAGNGVNPTAASPVSNFQFRCWGKTPINGAPYSNTTMFYIAIGF